MFRSIRWRLVASYMLLTLLAVGSVGVLALSLIKQYVEQQEQEHLAANAEAVARQALPLMEPQVRPLELLELVRTASFAGSVQVRILNDRQHVLADSGQLSGVNEFVWVTIPLRMMHVQVTRESPVAVVILPDGRQVGARDELLTIFEQVSRDADGTVVRRIEGPWGSRFFFADIQELEVMPAFPTTDAPMWEEILAEQRNASFVRTVTVPIGETDSPAGYVELSKGPGFAAEALATAHRAFLLAAGGATSLAVIVGLLVSRGLTAPLRTLTSTAGQMSSGDLSIRAPVRGKDEIGQLARQFNHMAERLESSFAELAAERDSLRCFVTDASHELRTPITALKNFNELLQGAAANDPAARVAFLAESQIQLDRLEWITNNLLDLSRLDAGLVTLNVSDHEVGELIRTAVAALNALAQEKNVTLVIEEPLPSLKIPCDRARIELALSNLLDNGVKFTPAGGRVEIGAEQAEQTARLWVRDSGPGIASEEQERIFERFYRGRDSSDEGVGLGLAIVKSIVQAHGGHVIVESELGAGSCFVIELPLA